MTDDEFTTRLRAAEAHLPDDDSDEPAPGALERASGAVDELTSDPAVLADPRRVAALRATVRWLYRVAQGWELDLPEGWSERQSARLGIPTAAEVAATEHAFEARLDAARVRAGRDGPRPGQEAFDRAFHALDELLADPEVQADEDWRAAVGAVAKQLHRQATTWGIALPEGWK